MPQPKDLKTNNVSLRQPASRTTPDLGLIALNAGTFTMGADDGPHPEDGEGPSRLVTLDAFSIAPMAVTNAQFKDFVRDTRYKTVAERTGTSFVFEMLLPKGIVDTLAGCCQTNENSHRISGAA